MIDLIVKLTEKVSELIKIRNEKKTRYFKEIIDVIFTDLKPIHRDYLNVIELLLKAVQGGTSLVEIDKDFSKRRLAFETERRQIMAMTRSLLQSEFPDEYRPFLETVQQYFQNNPIGTPTTTKYAELGRALSPYADFTREARLLLLEEVLGKLRDSFFEIAALHAKARLAAIT